MGLRIGSAFQAADLARAGAATMVSAAGRAAVRGSPSLPRPFQLGVWGVGSDLSVEMFPMWKSVFPVFSFRNVRISIEVLICRLDFVRKKQ